MNRLTSKLTLAAITFTVVSVSSIREAPAEVRRGLLYDMFHFGSRYDSSGGRCDSHEGCSPSGCSPSGCSLSHRLEGWIGSQLAAEKWRIREDVRFYRFHFYLQKQDKKKLLHQECPPFQDCYWGYYPTCWREFPREPYCTNGPPDGPDSMYYDEAGPLNPPSGDWDQETYEPGPTDPPPGPEFSDSLPPLPNEPLPDEPLPDPAPAPYVE